MARAETLAPGVHFRVGGAFTPAPRRPGHAEDGASSRFDPRCAVSARPRRGGMDAAPPGRGGARVVGDRRGARRRRRRRDRLGPASLTAQSDPRVGTTHRARFVLPLRGMQRPGVRAPYGSFCGPGSSRPASRSPGIASSRGTTSCTCRARSPWSARRFPTTFGRGHRPGTTDCRTQGPRRRRTGRRPPPRRMRTVASSDVHERSGSSSPPPQSGARISPGSVRCLARTCQRVALPWRLWQDPSVNVEA